MRTATTVQRLAVLAIELASNVHPRALAAVWHYLNGETSVLKSKVNNGPGRKKRISADSTKAWKKDHQQRMCVGGVCARRLLPPGLRSAHAAEHPDLDRDARLARRRQRLRTCPGSAGALGKEHEIPHLAPIRRVLLCRQAPGSKRQKRKKKKKPLEMTSGASVEAVPTHEGGAVAVAKTAYAVPTPNALEVAVGAGVPKSSLAEATNLLSKTAAGDVTGELSVGAADWGMSEPTSDATIAKLRNKLPEDDGGKDPSRGAVTGTGAGASTSTDAGMLGGGREVKESCGIPVVTLMVTPMQQDTILTTGHTAPETTNAVGGGHTDLSERPAERTLSGLATAVSTPDAGDSTAMDVDVGNKGSTDAGVGDEGSVDVNAGDEWGKGAGPPQAVAFEVHASPNSAAESHACSSTANAHVDAAEGSEKEYTETEVEDQGAEMTVMMEPEAATKTMDEDVAAGPDPAVGRAVGTQAEQFVEREEKAPKKLRRSGCVAPRAPLVSPIPPGVVIRTWAEFLKYGNGRSKKDMSTLWAMHKAEHPDVHPPKQDEPARKGPGRAKGKKRKRSQGGSSRGPAKLVSRDTGGTVDADGTDGRRRSSRATYDQAAKHRMANELAVEKLLEADDDESDSDRELDRILAADARQRADEDDESEGGELAEGKTPPVMSGRRLIPLGDQVAIPAADARRAGRKAGACHISSASYTKHGQCLMPLNGVWFGQTRAVRTIPQLVVQLRIFDACLDFEAIETTTPVGGKDAARAPSPKNAPNIGEETPLYIEDMRLVRGDVEYKVKESKAVVAEREAVLLAAKVEAEDTVVNPTDDATAARTAAVDAKAAIAASGTASKAKSKSKVKAKEGDDEIEEDGVGGGSEEEHSQGTVETWVSELDVGVGDILVFNLRLVHARKEEARPFVEEELQRQQLLLQKARFQSTHMSAQQQAQAQAQAQANGTSFFARAATIILPGCWPYLGITSSTTPLSPHRSRNTNTSINISNTLIPSGISGEFRIVIIFIIASRGYLKATDTADSSFHALCGRGVGL